MDAWKQFDVDMYHALHVLWLNRYQYRVIASRILMRSKCLTHFKVCCFVCSCETNSQWRYTQSCGPLEGSI
jgi:hypothetical protein